MSSIKDQRPLYEVKANLFKGLAHPFRIRILELLSAAQIRAQAEDPVPEAGRTPAPESGDVPVPEADKTNAAGTGKTPAAQAGAPAAQSEAPAAPSEALAAEAGEMSVAALLRETGLEASHLSQHLAVLRRHRLVESQRRGSHVYYRLLHSRVADMLAVVRSLVLDTLAADEKLLAEAGTLPQLPTAPLQEGERS